MLVFASAFDLLDGAVARATGRATRGGAILDAVADRVAEFAMLLGLLVWFSALNHFDRETIILLGVVLAGSMLVPYTRSKAAEFGVPLPHQGLGTRDSRVVILSIGLFANETHRGALDPGGVHEPHRLAAAGPGALGRPP